MPFAVLPRNVSSSPSSWMMPDSTQRTHPRWTRQLIAKRPATPSKSGCRAESSSVGETNTPPHRPLPTDCPLRATVSSNLRGGDGFPTGVRPDDSHRVEGPPQNRSGSAFVLELLVAGATVNRTTRCRLEGHGGLRPAGSADRVETRSRRASVASAASSTRTEGPATRRTGALIRRPRPPLKAATTTASTRATSTTSRTPFLTRRSRGRLVFAGLSALAATLGRLREAPLRIPRLVRRRMGELLPTVPTQDHHVLEVQTWLLARWGKRPSWGPQDVTG
jgi:hypothetical protein